jgi:DNA-binding protein HU-beta
MNQTELIQEVADEANLTKTQAQDAVRALLKTIMGVVADGDKITLVGFGSFEPKVRSAREGRNPQTGETIQIPAARVPSFSAGKTFREAVNKQQTAG